MRKKKWGEISKRYVSVWKWRNYVEIVSQSSDINIGLPSFVMLQSGVQKTGLPEDPLYLEIHPCPKPLSVITFHVVVMTSSQSQELTFLCYLLICLKQWHQGPEWAFVDFFPNSSPKVQFSLSSNLQSVDWVAAGRQPLGPHMAWPFAPGFKLLLLSLYVSIVSIRYMY